MTCASSRPNSHKPRLTGGCSCSLSAHHISPLAEKSSLDQGAEDSIQRSPPPHTHTGSLHRSLPYSGTWLTHCPRGFFRIRHALCLTTHWVTMATRPQGLPWRLQGTERCAQHGLGYKALPSGSCHPFKITMSAPVSGLNILVRGPLIFSWMLLVTESSPSQEVTCSLQGHSYCLTELNILPCILPFVKSYYHC